MKEIIGKVVSNKTPKTLIVEVETQRLHPLYKKFMKSKKKYKVHYEDLSVKVGDVVKIVSVRPISKEKHFKLAGKVSL